MAMKYRIEAVELSNGSTEYYPQYKFLFFWFYFGNIKGNIIFSNILEAKKFIAFQQRLKRKQNIRYIEISDDSK